MGHHGQLVGCCNRLLPSQNCGLIDRVEPCTLLHHRYSIVKGTSTSPGAAVTVKTINVTNCWFEDNAGKGCARFRAFVSLRGVLTVKPSIHRRRCHSGDFKKYQCLERHLSLTIPQEYGHQWRSNLRQRYHRLGLHLRSREPGH